MFKKARKKLGRRVMVASAAVLAVQTAKQIIVAKAGQHADAVDISFGSYEPQLTERQRQHIKTLTLVAAAGNAVNPRQYMQRAAQRARRAQSRRTLADVLRGNNGRQEHTSILEHLTGGRLEDLPPTPREHFGNGGFGDQHVAFTRSTPDLPDFPPSARVWDDPYGLRVAKTHTQNPHVRQADTGTDNESVHPHVD